MSMNKKEAQQKLVAYKNEKREEQYELEHGILDKFVPKYVEKIPLGNGKFKYLYQEDIDRMKEAANKVKDAAQGAASKVKDTATSAYNTAKNATSSAVSNIKDAAQGAASKVKDTATSAYNTAKNATSSAVSSTKSFLNITKNGKMTDIEKANRESVRSARSEAAREKESSARKAAIEAINKRTIDEAEKAREDKRMADAKNDTRKQSAKSAFDYELEQIGAGKLADRSGRREEVVGSQKEEAADNLINRLMYDNKDMEEALKEIELRKREFGEDSKVVTGDQVLKRYLNTAMKGLEKIEDDYVGRDNNVESLNEEQQYILNAINHYKKLVQDYLDDIPKYREALLGQ